MAKELSSIEIIRNIEWGRTYKWEVFLPNDKPPAPFDKFFPASDVTLPIAGVESVPIQTAVRGLEVPDGVGAHRLSITFYDDENCTLQTYFETWLNDLTNHGMFVTAVADASRLIMVDLLNAKDARVKTYKFLVFPVGELTFSGTSTSGIVTYSLDFVISGHIT